MDIETRFQEKYQANSQTGCWDWTAGTSMNRDGARYSDFYFDGRSGYGHRFSYQFYRGTIPAGLTIDHLCRNTLCVNPDHLEAVTMKVNILRGSGVSVQNAAKNSCPAGHAYDTPNTYLDKVGNRHCRACRRVQQRDFHAKRKGVIYAN